MARRGFVVRFQVNCPIPSSHFSSYLHSFVSLVFHELSIPDDPRDDAIISCSDPRSKMTQLNKHTKRPSLLVEVSSL